MYASQTYYNLNVNYVIITETGMLLCVFTTYLSLLVLPVPTNAQYMYTYFVKFEMLSTAIKTNVEPQIESTNKKP